MQLCPYISLQSAKWQGHFFQSLGVDGLAQEVALYPTAKTYRSDLVSCAVSMYDNKF